MLFKHIDAFGNQTSDTRSGTAYATTISNAGRISQLSVAGSVKGNYSYDGRRGSVTPVRLLVLS